MTSAMESWGGYGIIRRLPGGGVTDLYVARDSSGIRVVLRLLKQEYISNGRMRRNFLAGAGIQAAIRHPNIPHVIKIGTTNRQPFMVLNYVEARNLRELILRRDHLLGENSPFLIRQMAAALLAVHNAGYLHLDFKPENLLVTENGNLHLIDFDLARPRRQWFFLWKKLSGTPAYMAPETFRGRRVDEQADVFSFGVTCYEMLTFHKPFELLATARNPAPQTDPASTPPPLTSYNPTLKPGWNQPILKCLAHDPKARYPSLVLFLKDLSKLA